MLATMSQIHQYAREKGESGLEKHEGDQEGDCLDRTSSASST
jgi:hypothetical protein